MAQKLKAARPIPHREFSKIAEAVISKNRKLLEMLAKV
jgi:hypothetical protein